MQISKYNYKDPNFPELLRQIASPPKQLFVKGQLATNPLVSVVGTRRPTTYGKQVTAQLVRELAGAGIGIVSGLAYGIDAVAHQAAVEAGGYTVAVLAHGLDEIYPAANRGLAEKILAQCGALVTEYEEGTESFKSNFVARNRIVAGLSLATIVPEADASSGSLITANFALQSDRLVMAVPGNITSPRSAGPNNLLRQGAIPVTSAADVLNALDLSTTALKRAPIKPESKEEAQIFELLDQGVTNSQELIAKSELTAAQFAQIISLMEITGKVRNLGAGIWIKA